MILSFSSLQPVSEASSYQTPYFIQEAPRKLRPPLNHTLLSVACDSRGVHALYNVQNQLRYMLFNLDSCKFHQNSHFNELSSKYLIKQGSLLQLVPINLSLGVVIDKYGGLFPISKNNVGNIRDLPLVVCLVVNKGGLLFISLFCCFSTFHQCLVWVWACAVVGIVWWVWS